MRALLQSRVSARAVLLGLAAALSLPASLQTTESFEPLDERFRLEGRRASWSFSLPEAESLFLEYALSFRTPDDVRPSLRVRLNGRDVTTAAAEHLYVADRGRLLLPGALVRDGVNALEFEVDGSAASSFDIDARVHNYYGINPRFPRVYIVSDDAVGHVRARQGLWHLMLRFGVYYSAALALVWAVTSRVGGRRGVFLAACSGTLFWATLVYGLLTPLHIWFSVEGTIAATLVATAFGWLILALNSRRQLVAEVAVMVAITVLLLEAALRVYNAMRPSPVFYDDSYSRYRGQPGAPFYDGRLNSRGFHDVDHSETKPSDVARRIVALGDSFAFGAVPYAANYLTLLETRLSGRVRTEVINMGVPAADPRDYLAILMHEGLAFDPDVVLTCVFVGNDFETPTKKTHEYSFVATLVHFLSTTWHATAPDGNLSGMNGAPYDDESPTFARDRFLEIEVDRAWVYSRQTDRLDAAVTGVVRTLREMRDITRARDVAMVVVVIPDEAQVNATLQAEVMRARRWTDTDADFQLPNRRLVAALEGEQIEVLDLLPAFRQRGRTERLYKPMDTHWNVAGNGLGAAEIATFLERRAGR